MLKNLRTHYMILQHICCFTSKVSLDLFILCEWVFCLRIGMYIMCVPGTQESQKRALDPLKLELEIVVSYSVDAGNWTQSSGTAVFLPSEPSLQSVLLHLFLHVFICVHTQQMEARGQCLDCSLSPFTIWVPGTELRSPGLKANALTDDYLAHPDLLFWDSVSGGTNWPQTCVAVESCVMPRLKGGAGFRLSPSWWWVLSVVNNSIYG